MGNLTPQPLSLHEHLFNFPIKPPGLLYITFPTGLHYLAKLPPDGPPGHHLWAPSCYHGSVGAGWDVVEKYILAHNTYGHNRR